MTNNNDWRLTPEIIAFIVLGVENKVVYLASPEKKTYRAAVSKLVGPCKEIQSSLNEFELKIQRTDYDEDPRVFIRNSEVLPDDDWYVVGNFYSPHLLDFFLELNSEKGVFAGETFEAVFSESDPNQVSFVSPGMPGYKKCLEEMRRRISCDSGKKTRKWIPGHRYDTMTGTYIYLAPVQSRRSAPNDSKFLDDASTVQAYLYVSDIDKSKKTISEVLKSGVYGDGEYDIKVSYTMPSAVDSGKILDDDYTAIEDYWPMMLDAAKKSATKIEEFGCERLIKIKKVFDVFCYQSPKNLGYKKEIVDVFRPILSEALDSILLSCWDLPRARKDLIVSSTASIEANVKALEKSLYLYTEDINTQRTDYYTEMFRVLGIDIAKEIEKRAVAWNTKDMLTDFDTFKKYSFYFDTRVAQGAITSRQRVDSTPYKLDVVSIENIFGAGELTESLKSLVNFTRENCGLGVSRFISYNNGTKKDPKEYVSIEISLNDLVKWCGGEEKMSDRLKKAILDKKFTRIFIAIDKNREVE